MNAKSKLIPADMLDKIALELKKLNSRSSNLAAFVPHKLYEIYIHSLVIEALNGVGVHMEVRDKDDKSTHLLVFRKGGSTGAGMSKYSGHIHCEWMGTEFRVENSLKFSGISGVDHELDVSIHLEGPPSRSYLSSPLLIVECKDYANSLPLYMGRAVLGLFVEFTDPAVRILVSSSDHPINERQLLRNRGDAFFYIDAKHQREVDILVGWLTIELGKLLNIISSHFYNDPWARHRRRWWRPT